MTDRITRLDVSSRSEPPAFSGVFESGLPSEQDYINQARRPDWKEIRDDRNPLLANRMQGNSVALSQASHVIVANRSWSALGSLGGELNAVKRISSQSTFNLDTVGRLALEGLDSALDLSGSLVGIIPFVGAFAKAALAAVRIGARIATRDDNGPPPPIFQSNPNDDKEEAELALLILRTEDDWTRIFLPKGTAIPFGWKHSLNEGGNQFYRQALPGGQMGCAPGSLYFIDDNLVQSRIAKTHSGHKNDKFDHNLLRKGHLEMMRERVFSTGEWKPSLMAVSRAAWSMTGSWDSTSMFAIDANRLAVEWQMFDDGMVAWRTEVAKFLGKKAFPNRTSTETREQLNAYFMGLFAAAQHDKIGINTDRDLENAIFRKPSGGKTVGKESVRHANALLDRQRAAMKTEMNALVSKNSAALIRNKELRTQFFRERTALLDAGRFDTMDLEDVPDEALRKRIQDRSKSTGGDVLVGSFADPVKVERQQRARREAQANLKSTVPRAPGFTPMGDLEDNTGTGSSLALGVFGAVAATAAAGAAGYALHRRRARK